MEKIKELEEVLGEENVHVLIDEVRDGMVKKEHLQLMALQMGGPVHGVFKEKSDKVEPQFVLRRVHHYKEFAMLLDDDDDTETKVISLNFP